MKKIVSIGNLVDSPTQQVRESFFDYKYLRDFEAKIITNGSQGSVKDSKEAIYAKKTENPPHCHVLLIQKCLYNPLILGWTACTYVRNMSSFLSSLSPNDTQTKHFMIGGRFVQKGWEDGFLIAAANLCT